MKPLTHCFALLCCLLLWATSSRAQTESAYRYDYLRITAEKLGLNGLDFSGDSPRRFKIKGKTVYVRYSEEQQAVEHIGRPLFAPDLRAMQPSPVYDYIEYAFLNQTFKLDEKTLAQGDIVFSKGNWNEMEKVTQMTRVSVSRVDNKRYKIEWSDKGAVIACLSFPIKYDRMANATSEEIENVFVKELKGYALNDSLLSACANYAEEFAAILGCKASTLLKYPLEAKIHKYDYQNEVVATNIATTLAFTAKDGCKPRWGTKSVTNDKVEGVFFLENVSSAYNHIFSIKCTKKSGKISKLTADLYLFIPTYNIKDLYKDKKK